MFTKPTYMEGESIEYYVSLSQFNTWIGGRRPKISLVSLYRMNQPQVHKGHIFIAPSMVGVRIEILLRAFKMRTYIFFSWPLGHGSDFAMNIVGMCIDWLAPSHTYSVTHIIHHHAWSSIQHLSHLDFQPLTVVSFFCF
jgi:hypothetical protein